MRRRRRKKKGCKTVCVATAAPAGKLGSAGDHIDELAVVMVVAGFVAGLT